MVKQYGPYELGSEHIPDVPAPYEYPHAIIGGDNLPMLRWYPWDDHSGKASCGSSYDGAASETATINGADGYRMDLTMDEPVAGHWELRKDEHGRDWDSVYLTRGFSNDATPAARKHVREVIVPAIAAWLESGAADRVLAAGRAHARAAAIERAARHVAETAKVYEAAQAELTVALAMPE